MNASEEVIFLETLLSSYFGFPRPAVPTVIALPFWRLLAPPAFYIRPIDLAPQTTCMTCDLLFCCRQF